MKSDLAYRTLRITEVSIRNFRSIRNLTLSVDGCTVISGLNDVGKSNVLKALNLFFNGETDYGSPYNFEDDYCLNAPVQKKKAKIIEIALKFRIPENFKDKGDVVWTKRWGRLGLVADTIREAVAAEDVIFVNKKPHPDKKVEIAKYICGVAKNEPSVFENFSEVVMQIENYFK